MVNPLLGEDPVYNPERDGEIRVYLEERKSGGAFPLFRGYSHFEMLVEKGYLVPCMSAIRLMWNFGRDDEYFFIDENFQLVGASNLPAHAGREGRFDPKAFLDGPNVPCWEAHDLNPSPVKVVDGEQ